MMSRISGNQTINSEQPNASVSGVSTAATDLASAATATAAATFNKQRKKRKKKKDKTLLTNQAANCSCGKRIESNYNSISSCSSCVPSACVYCHFNDLAYRENYSTRHPGDSIDCTIKTDPSLDIWPQRIGDDDDVDNDTQCVITENTQNNGKYFMRHQRNIGLNRRTEQLQRFAVYENLCEFCGFAIGNGAYHLHCDASTRNIHNDGIHIDDDGDNDQASQVIPESIYENICESCHSIFDGEQCASETCKVNNSLIESIPTVGEVINVLVKKPPTIANRQFGKQFSEFLGSFRQKLTNSKSCETERRKKPKIEIIHNTDEVFKTNRTFDLNEIVQLKNQSLSGVRKVDSRNVCSELRNISSDIVTKVPSKPIQLFRTSTSDSNFLENYHLTPPYLQSPFSESIVSDTVLYSNSYAPPSYEDAIQHSKYASVAPFKLRGRIKPSIYDSTSASSFFTYNSSVSTLQSHTFTTDRKSSLVSALVDCDDPVKQWLESIKRQTHEYANDNRQFECGSIKCLPSKMLNENATQLKWSIEHGDSMNSAAHQVDETQTKLRRRIELFKENLVEQRMPSKRNAIYIKDSICDVTFDATMPPDTQAPDIEMTTATTSLIPFCHRIDSDSAENSDENVCLRSKNHQLTPSTAQSSSVAVWQDEQQHINHNVALEATSQYLQMLKTFYMAQVTLSTSLNRITLVCGDRQLHFFVKYLISQPQNSLEHSNKLVKPTKYTNIQQIIELVQKMSDTKQLGECDKGAKREPCHFDNGDKGRPEIVSGFLMRLTNSPSRTPLRSRPKRNIDDFAKRMQRTHAAHTEQAKTLDDFSKTATKDTDIPTKSLNDFAKEIPHYSSEMDTSYRNESHGNESANEDEESIYQPIWMFKTVGSADDLTYDDGSLNNFDTCEIETDDTTSRDGHEWEVAQEEFLFSSQRIDGIQYSNSTRPMSHTSMCKKQLSEVSTQNKYKRSDKCPYQTICVLYNTNEPKWNEIIYDYNCYAMQVNENKENKAENRTVEGSKYNRMMQEIRSKEVNALQKQSHQLCNGQEIPIKLDSINAWKSMLRAVDYIEDEEDVVSLILGFIDIQTYGNMKTSIF